MNLENLAGTKNSQRIRIELARCRIDTLVVDRLGHEVSTEIGGILGEFRFVRAWRYWIVSGPFPLDVAAKLYETEPAWATDVRAGGHCGAEHPKLHATHFAASGKRLARESERTKAREFLESKTESMRRIASEVLETHEFAEDPAAAAHHSVVEDFHIDTELGLRLFADAARALDGRLMPTRAVDSRAWTDRMEIPTPVARLTGGSGGNEI